MPSNATDPVSYAKAMDLCVETSENPLPTDPAWGLIEAELLLPDETGSPAAASHSIRPAFGANFPQSGNRFVVLSTGNAAAPGQTNPGHVNFQTAPVLGTQSEFPSDWFSANGNALPSAPGCPSPTGTTAQDPVMLKLRIRVPADARSFRVSTRFFSAEYPEFVCSPFNDFYVILLDSSFAGFPANPSDKNLGQYHPGGGLSYPIGVNLAFGNTGLFQTCKNGATGCDPGATAGITSSCTSTSDLVGTGFDLTLGGCGNNDLLGGGTAWLRTYGNVVPGETIELRFALWDTSDGLYDSLALIDDFQWSTERTTPGTYLGAPPPVPVPGDLNGDRAVDLVWRNYDSGAVNVWFLAGTTYTGGQSLFTISDPMWRIEGTGDFNSDGKTDLIWRNYTSGAVNVWFLDGTTYAGGANLFTVADPNWEIEAVGDFNGDGGNDLIWRNYATGAVNVWFLNGTTYTGGAPLFTVADPNWKIEVAGDFNGDGKTDLVWRNYATGAVNVWFLNGTAYLGGANLFTVADANWRIEAVGDYSGDGKLDLIWRNYATGAVNVWFLNGTAYMGGASLFTVAGASWEIAGPR